MHARTAQRSACAPGPASPASGARAAPASPGLTQARLTVQRIKKIQNRFAPARLFRFARIMVSSQETEIQLQDIEHENSPVATKSNENSAIPSCNTESGARNGASVVIEHLYVDRWCTYYELSVSLGACWWEHRQQFEFWESDDLHEKEKLQSTCGWTVHRRYNCKTLYFIVTSDKFPDGFAGIGTFVNLTRCSEDLFHRRR